jgi:hypothetical protein
MWTLGIDGIAALAPDARGRAIAQLCEALAEVDLEYLRARPETVGLYASGVRYREMPSLLADVATVLRLGEADCKSLVAWRLAELRREGLTCAVRVAMYPNGDMHVELTREDGRLEDPSSLIPKAYP